MFNALNFFLVSIGFVFFALSILIVVFAVKIMRDD